MSIIIRLDRLLAEKKMSSKDLAERIGTTPVNLSRIKCGQIQGVRLNTMNALCTALDCQPGDLFEFVPDTPCENQDTQD